MIRAFIVTWLIGIALALGIITWAEAAPIDDLVSGYAGGTWQADDPDYAALYAQTSDRTLTLSHVTEQEGRTAAIYELSYRHAGGEYRETGVLVLYHDPVKLEFVAVEDLDPTTIDMAVAGQAADIGSTALALSQGFVEGNPVVAGALSTPAGTAAIIALKLAGPSLANNLSLDNCTAVRAGLAAAGWSAAVWNIAAVAGAGMGVGAVLAMVTAWFTGQAAISDAPLRCAGIIDTKDTE
jgi:hypothetical protein